jgi:Trk K+ transport system NAD-binding subunit
MSVPTANSADFARNPAARPGPMADVTYLVLRRMRTPLILLTLVISFCVFGLSLMPGVDANGDPAPSMSIFDAFYVILYTATTIGFGEIPAPYSTPQRMWMVLAIVLTVIAWSYALVTMIALVQEKGFQTALRIGRFSRRIYQLREPFFIVCGAGETGILVCHGLDRLGYRFVVLDEDDTRLQQLRLDDFQTDAPMMIADASQPATLRAAGLLNSHCKGVMALLDDDVSNQAIAVTTRLLAPRVTVLARIRDSETESHVGVFGGDLVINPFDRFAEHLGAAVAAPQRYRLREILTGLEGDPMPAEHRPPKGHWIMCGYGRFGHAVAEELRATGNTVSVVDVSHFEQGGVDVYGTGTDSESLLAAGLEEAVGIVAGNSTDTKNLAIAVTARDLKPDIFIVTRQNQNANSPLFDAFVDDLAMVPSKIVASEFLARITTPLLVRFLNRLPFHNEEQCAELSAKFAQVNGGLIPVIWSQKLDKKNAEGAVTFLSEGQSLTLGDLKMSNIDSSGELPVVVMLVARSHKVIEQPADDFELKVGDEVLFAGSERAKLWISARMANVNALELITTGRNSQGGAVFRWLRKKYKASHPVQVPVDSAGALVDKSLVGSAERPGTEETSGGGQR